MDTFLFDSSETFREPVTETLPLASGASADEGEKKALSELERLNDRVAAARLVF